MVKVYLLINAGFYLMFSLWCLFNPKGTATFQGYDFLNNSGKTEYLSVYAGLEFGFSVFLALSAFLPSARLAGLIFCVCIYGGLMIVRPIAAIVYGNVDKATYLIGSLEYVLGIVGIILLVRDYGFKG